MAAALLLETSLLIVRSNMPEPLEKKYAHLMGGRREWREKRAQELAAAEGAAAGGAGRGGGAAASDVGGESAAEVKKTK